MESRTCGHINVLEHFQAERFKVLPDYFCPRSIIDSLIRKKYRRHRRYPNPPADYRALFEGYGQVRRWAGIPEKVEVLTPDQNHTGIWQSTHEIAFSIAKKLLPQRRFVRVADAVARQGVVVNEHWRRASDIAQKLGVTFRVSIDKRIAGAEAVGAHKTSMLQDVEAGRSLETEALIGSILEMAKLTNTPAPAIESVYALVKLLNKVMLLEGGGVKVEKIGKAA
jgi:hypothetical protein